MATLAGAAGRVCDVTLVGVLESCATTPAFRIDALAGVETPVFGSFSGHLTGVRNGSVVRIARQDPR